MKMVMKGRILSLFGHYDVYQEPGNRLLYNVQGELSWAGKFVISNPEGKELAIIRRKLISIFPTFEIEENGQTVGSIEKEFSLFHPKYKIRYKDWHVDGDIFQLNYSVKSASGQLIADIRQKILALTQTFEINCPNPANALNVVVLATAIARVEIEEQQNNSNNSSSSQN